LTDDVIEPDWEADLAALLSELSAVQDDLLALLADKTRLLLAADGAGLSAQATQEAALIGRLQQCYEHRLRLLDEAARAGLPSASVRVLASALPAAPRLALNRRIKEAQARSRLVEHQSLSNWVLVQRTLLHLSQLLEIIATSGRPQPTYGRSESANSAGALVDRAA